MKWSSGGDSGARRLAGGGGNVLGTALFVTLVSVTTAWYGYALGRESARKELAGVIRELRASQQQGGGNGGSGGDDEREARGASRSRASRLSVDGDRGTR